MSQLDETTREGLRVQEAAPVAVDRPHLSVAMVLGAGALVGWPFLYALSELISVFQDEVPDRKAEFGEFLRQVSASTGLWNLTSVVMLAMAVLTVVAVPVTWRLTTSRAPRLGWAATVLLALLAWGQIVHLLSWQVLIPALAESGLDESAARAVMEAIDAQWLFPVIFAPILIGFIFAPPVLAVALSRSGWLPRWALIVALVSSVGGLVGDPVAGVTMVAFAVCMVPVLIKVIRARKTSRE